MRQHTKLQTILGFVFSVLLAVQPFYVSHGKPTVSRSNQRLSASKSPPVLVDLYGEPDLEVEDLSSYIANKNIYLSLSDAKTLELNFDSEANLPNPPLSYQANHSVDTLDDEIDDDELDLVGVLQIQPKSSMIWFGAGEDDTQDNQKETLDTLLPYLVSNSTAPSFSTETSSAQQFCDGSFTTLPDFALTDEVSQPRLSLYAIRGIEYRSNYIPKLFCSYLHQRAPPSRLA